MTWRLEKTEMCLNLKNSVGQLLLEVLIALTILGLVAVAVVKVSTKSLKGARLTGDRKEALSLAKQVMVEVERRRGEDVTLFFTGSDGTENCGPLGENNEYSCTISYDFDSPPDSSNVEVKILIEWFEGDGTSSVDLDKIFTKVRL